MDLLTTNKVAELQGITPQRVVQIIKELGLEPQRIGTNFLLTTDEYRQIAQRNSTKGRPKKVN